MAKASKPAGPGRGHKKVKVVASPPDVASAANYEQSDILTTTASMVWQLNVQLVHLNKELSCEQAKNAILTRKLATFEAALAGVKGDVKKLAEGHSTSKTLLGGTGYGDLDDDNVQRTIRRHVTHVLNAVHEKAGGDTA